MGEAKTQGQPLETLLVTADKLRSIVAQGSERAWLRYRLSILEK